MNDFFGGAFFAGDFFESIITEVKQLWIEIRSFTQSRRIQMSTNLKAITSRLGYQQITDLDPAVGLTVPTKNLSGLASTPSIALITPEAQAVRWRDDGVAPTSTVGMPLAVGVTLQYDGDLTQIQFFEQAGGAKLNISYYA